MGKASDPSDFDRRQNWIAQWLIMSIAETAHLVGCLWHIILGTYAKWMNEGETISRCHGVGPPDVIKEKRCWKLSRLEKQNWINWHSNTMQVLEELIWSTQFRWYYWIRDYVANFLLICLWWPSIITNYFYTMSQNIMIGPWIIGRKLPGCKTRESSCYMSMSMLGYDHVWGKLILLIYIAGHA